MQIDLAPGPSGPEPVAGRVPVLDIVATAYRDGVEAGQARIASAATRADLDAVLTYCAEQRCVADRAACRGCRRFNELHGIATFDDFCAKASRIDASASGLAIIGGGAGGEAVQTDSLHHLAETWRGEEVWFLARRVIRRLVKAANPRPKAMAGPLGGAGDAPVVILVRPQLADNIGAAARAMANFGLEDMRLVAPRDGWPNEKARAAAAGANFIVDAASAHDTLAEGMVGLHWVCATTARQRDLAKPVFTPEQAVGEMRGRIAAGQRCAILFGPERTGLEQSEIANADALVMAPVNPNFASLNLAQAVLLLAYEWMRQTGGGTLGRVTTYERPLASGPRTRGAAPATKEQLLGFFEHLETELDRMGFLYPPAKRPTMVQNLRSMFTRMDATEQEISTLRGIVKALVHGKGPGRRLP